MNIQQMPVDVIRPYHRNPRKNEGAIEKIQQSIQRFGFVQPLVIDRDNVIIIGHTRFEAAKRLGMPEVACVVAESLTADEARALRIADNKAHEFAAWDEEALRVELLELQSAGFEMDDTLLDDVEIAELLDPALAADDTQGDGEGETGYVIQYNIIFNDEQEQDSWHDFLMKLKLAYPHYETISERLIAYIHDHPVK